MSLKQQLINTLNDYKKTYENIQAERNRISEDPSYTDVGREQKNCEVLERYKPIVQRYHDTACGIVDNGIEQLKEKWKKDITKHLTDAGYQAGLQNVLEMFKTDAVKRADDVRAILQNYEGDFSSLELIKTTIMNCSKNEEILAAAFEIQTDNRDYNISLLERTRANIDGICNITAIENVSNVPKKWNTWNQNLTGVPVIIDGIIQFCNTRLNDDLSLQPNR